MGAECTVQYPAPHESPQDAATDPGLYRLGIVRIHLVDGVETYPALRIGLEYPFNDTDMEASMQIERGAEAVNEGDRTGGLMKIRSELIE